ncbi:MAG TPA: LysR family transcriptional regulator [Burkholderiales bacterium]|nr:LysR family transcriptional regulator [Burkholderiales bacterium]
MHFTLRQLQVFDAVARELSFSRAARELHLTQPAVSMQVKQLEGQAGLPLFELVGRRLHLTEAGRALHHQAHAIQRQIEETSQTLAALRGVNQGTLDITLISTAKYFAPKYLARFCAPYAGVKLKLTVCNRAALLQRLMDNETDLAIMGHPPEGLNIVAEPFARNPHAIIAPPNHPLARARRIPWPRLASENFLVREPGSGTRRLMERVFRDHGRSVNATMEISSDETIKQAAMAGMGIAFLSLNTVELERQTGRLVVLDVIGTPVMRDWYIVHRKDKRLPPVASAFREFLLAQANAAPPRRSVPLKRARPRPVADHPDASHQ